MGGGKGGKQMPEVITEYEIKKYAGCPKVVFPSGTVITPSAKDWAKANNIQIIYGINHSTACDASSKPAPGEEAALTTMEREELLRKMVGAVAGELEKAGLPLQEKILIQAVTESLRKMGCRVEN